MTEDKKDDSFDLTQFYQIFFEEAGENLETMEQQLLELDVENPDDEELNAIFRCAHSIKGGAATFGFEDVAEMTHQMESLLDKLRRHELTLTSPMVDVLLEASDVLKGLLARHQGLDAAPVETGDLVARIRVLASGGGAAPRVDHGDVDALPVAEAADRADSPLALTRNIRSSRREEERDFSAKAQRFAKAQKDKNPGFFASLRTFAPLR